MQIAYMKAALTVVRGEEVREVVPVLAIVLVATPAKLVTTDRFTIFWLADISPHFPNT